ncbi:MBL fold metallo-hydrolase [Steroidobacter sp. S1-65]|uniref:MBL fold metallo-hydrolase n=1 Tax=Steroidobacter gossypii TaxID=2805490 RepID=A0ABS1X225_9GAMM|nr:MBL fold metallo-hydrolase [Steroidobacter gossypii]MBM0107265.1 MBL fold metallo-hydrolase [Steroidobacter gossypii]
MSATSTEFCQHLEHGITVIDTGFVRPRFDAAYLIVENGHAAYIDTGPNAAVPRLLAALEAVGLERSAVDYVIPTHVHLDHAGGAGLLMRELPNARMLIHPRGARHMIDPTVLMEGVRAVYGVEVANRDYGELVPVPEERVTTTSDGMVVSLGGRPLRFMDTPGHAKHHHCIWDEASQGWFTGDTFGLAYPELHTPRGPYVVPATAPIQFDPKALHESVARLLAQRPALMYLTHYGAVGNPEALAVQFLAQVDAMVDAARELSRVADRHEQLRRAFADIYIAELRRCGSTLPESFLREALATDIELNAQGLGAWLDKQ